MKENIEKAYQLIAAMAVSGDNQDLAAAAKQELRAALREIKTREEIERRGEQSDQ